MSWFSFELSHDVRKINASDGQATVQLILWPLIKQNGISPVERKIGSTAFSLNLDTVFTRISAAALIKFLVPQVRR